MSNSRRPIGAHLVGTVPLESAEEVFRTASNLLGGNLKRIPDGETGARKDWIWIQAPVLERVSGLERRDVDVPVFGRVPKFRPADGVSVDDLELGPLGYAEFATESYRVFSDLKAQGVIGEDVRLQVTMPTPLTPAVLFGDEDARPVVEQLYTQASLRELETILERIPHEELAFQWDNCVEFLMSAGYPLAQPWFDDVHQGIRDRMQRLTSVVPSEVDLGFHLCYGDFSHERQVDLEDARSLVDFANNLVTTVPRHISYIHMPVNCGRDPKSFLPPLADLKLEPGTDLYLGLLHQDDGVEGARKRIEAAGEYVTEFGVAAECGMGRRPAEAIRPLLEIHQAACDVSF
ncbi:MAG: hypothetical protein M0026_21770 [Nocardiopsaceae bacterium]|nr:hypothetical protein [Nocardiopsaceae bacterium]